MRYQLPTEARLQCPDCGTPVVDIQTPPEYDGVIRLNPCAHETTPGELAEAWRA